MKRQRRLETEENSERWVVSYADFMTLLLAFFVVLFATSQRDADKSKKFEESVKKYLMNFGGGAGVQIGQPGKGPSQESPIAQPLRKFEGPRKGADSQQQIERFVEDELTEEEIEKLILDIGSTSIGVRISFRSDNLFAEGSAHLTPSGQRLLDKVIPILKKGNSRYFIEGHTGTRTRIPSQFSDSWGYAAARAQSFLKYLLQDSGFSTDRFAMISYGSQRPIYSENRDDLNNRIDLLIASDDFQL